MNPRDLAPAAIEQTAKAEMARKYVRGLLVALRTMENSKLEIRMTNQTRMAKIRNSPVSSFEF